jgi:hypothetical protein
LLLKQNLLIDALISSKTRIKLLLKFFLNSNVSAYLRSLEEEFGESTNGIRIELNRFENAGMLLSSMEGNKKLFRVNASHPLYFDIRNMLIKAVGLHDIVDTIVDRLGNIERIYVTGPMAKGIDTREISLQLKGDIDRVFLQSLIQKIEPKINRTITCTIINPESETTDTIEEGRLLLWEK